MQTKALIFDIQDLSVQDGPGIRTTVFMKGCPLKCKWCANPEGQNPFPELMHSKSLCKKKYNCLTACPYNSAKLNSESNSPQFNREICKNCITVNCIDSCPSYAIRISGKYILLEELISRVKSNLSFYKNSGGGVTFSGGEPFLQADFIKEFLKITSSFGLSVVVETCGMFDWTDIENIVDNIDFFYYDLKCLNSKLHKNVTGSTNEKIITNLKNLSEYNSQKIIVTIPVIPGVNDNEDEIKAITTLCIDQNILKVRLLPYHSLGENKYYNLGMKYLNAGSNKLICRLQLYILYIFLLFLPKLVFGKESKTFITAKNICYLNLIFLICLTIN